MSNDDAGTISFRVGLPAVTALPDNMALAILLDSDLDTAESTPFDDGISLIRNSAVLFPITPAGVGTAFIARSLTTRFVHASVARGEIGGPRVLLASVGSFTLAPDGTPDTTANTDLAPAEGVLAHALKLPTKLLARSTSLSPGRPAAGARFRAGVFVRDVTFGVPGDLPKGGRVTCRFTIGGKKVTAARSLTPAGRATCAGAVPPGAAGRPLRGTVTYALNGAVLKRSFAATVGG